MITKEALLNIAILFKATRKFYRLQQTEFAAILQVTQGTISKIESASMHPELGLWFKFLKAFNVIDPYCFTYGGVEFSESSFSNLKKEGSSLAPRFNFENNDTILKVRKIRPIVDILIKKHSKVFETYLKENKIGVEIFYILNHPLSTDFVDSFFTFLDQNKITAKSLSYLDLHFESSLGRIKDSLVSSSHRPEDFFNILNSNGDALARYNFKGKEGEYYFNINPELNKKVQELENKDFIINFDILYPYNVMKSTKIFEVGTPEIVVTQKDSEWKVVYA